MNDSDLWFISSLTLEGYHSTLNIYSTIHKWETKLIHRRVGYVLQAAYLVQDCQKTENVKIPWKS